MMIKKFLCVIALVCCAAGTVCAQQAYDVKYDSVGNKVLMGPINEQLLANDSAFRWFFTGVNSYNPDNAWVRYISFYRDSFDVVAFVGTWCEDSKRLLPQFYRVMMAASYPMSRIKLYGLDHALKGKGGAERTYDVNKVPSFILLHNGKEIGRITDHLQRSMEADMVSLLQRTFRPQDAGTAAATQ